MEPVLEGPYADLPPMPRGRQPNALYFKVGEMDGKLDQLLALVIPQLKDFDARISNLEIWQGRLLGGFAVIVFLVGGVEVFRALIH